MTPVETRPVTSQVGSTDSAARKEFPIARGVLDYFPAALAHVARGSYLGNLKHNPGEDMHHARGKSMDHADCIVRHLADRGTFDEIKVEEADGTITVHRIRHSVWVAWRALALLQEELEADGEAPPARAARFPAEDPKLDPGNRDDAIEGTCVQWNLANGRPLSDGILG